MSSLTTNPARRAAGAHRARIVAEAVVSAYIHEITPTRHRHEPARIRHRCADVSPKTLSRAPLTAHARRPAIRPRHRNALPLGA
jgi:hypothetical protein